MGNEENGRSASANLMNSLHTLVHKIGVTRGQCLVDDQDIGVNTDCGGECEARLHAARIRLERLVVNALELGEGDAAGGLSGNLLSAHTCGHAPEHDVLTTRLVVVEAGAEFE